MSRVYRFVLPEVRATLAQWREKAECIPDPELRKQAIDSITHKEFHCQGGAVYAAANISMRHVLIPLIVALQTISDYLDNLCDRSTSLDPEDFRLLHQSMLDAVNPNATLQNYYALRTEQDDGGYLHDLVEECRRCIGQLPSYPLVASSVTSFVKLYTDLQVYKHIHRDLREDSLVNWWKQHRDNYPELHWNEFAAATGSTLGMFMLFLAAADTNLQASEVERITQAYFPSVNGLHILLDYLIDQQEDQVGGDLNFCTYYDNMNTTTLRIAYMVEQARGQIMHLEHPLFHRMIIEGLLALYLSDPKVRTQPEVKAVSRKLMVKSPLTRLFFFVNSLVIRFTNQKSTS
ncbi:tetraprenyl-beta-curcumene synthase family protein [Paenibacillus sp. N1-5-1-14]|uniref:tetraprenyl-beta-curcumene synthase family protein n=1 Tax=Paenibacillus radicibacter TaxID=2972488 RepID=UPI002158B7FB|nr:tetraprenyl-beta-curcumene synthase family protein [Paenibacillus radicibacter]MCR8643884.1 tetraprenyl-beta-curcumene synthase family protein [Paenibacillus radicibacter]